MLGRAPSPNRAAFGAWFIEVVVEVSVMKLLPVLGLLAATASTPGFACASCGCALTSDWLNQGFVAQPGTSVSLRYDYVPQTELRAGAHAIGRREIALPADREIERYTYNHYLTATIDRQFSSDWGLNVQVPLVYRPHATIAEGEENPSFSHTGGIGDVRVTARWQGFSTPGSINGIQAGLVLPTGRFRQRFRSGSEQGEEVDRGLQPGFGALQAALGYYRFGRAARDLDYIVQIEAQVPINRRDGFRPGVTGQASAALHYTRWRGFTPELQMAVKASGRDAGVNSDRANSGGLQLYAAPGLVAILSAGTSVFAHVQLPLYQRVNGYQLTPQATASLGIQHRF